MKMQEKNGKLKALRHSAEHVLHQAMVELFPGLKRAMGPATDDGYYHDFDYDGKVSKDDFLKIEKRMQEIIAANLPIIRKEISVNEAKKMFKDNPYKLDWIDQIEKKGEKATVYWTGEPNQPGSDVDLCRGPHVKSTGEIGAFKLLSVAGAYWHGDEKNKMLTRIYGTAFKTKKELDKYLWQIEEAKKRDHRKLGKELDLFSFHDEGPGFPFWHPKGVVLYNELIKFWRKEHYIRGYIEVKTPIILNKDLWVRSGHWDHYRENMYFLPIDETDYAVKPMNCPGGALIYKTKVRSYRDLPMEVGELGLVHRHELSGVLHGLFRVRAFTQDDAHLYCTPDQAVEEVIEVLDLVEVIYSAFGLDDYFIELSTQPEKFMGTQKMWDNATKFLKKALKIKKLDYKLNPGDGAFYGPKIDFHIKDCLDRTWQCGTVQLDFAMPEAFDLTYIGKDGNKHRPIMIHRTIYGALERFIGILIEHYAGAFPVWLAPLQAIIIPIKDKNNNYASKVRAKLLDENIRVELDDRKESMQAKIRDAQLQKIPYMLIIGEKEEKSGEVSVRLRTKKDLGGVTLATFIKTVKNKIENKSLDL